jgi:D-aspartate ligase
VRSLTGYRPASPRPAGHFPAGEFDVSVPAVVLKIGQYPAAPGMLAVVRTLGRLGVPVYALAEPGITPAAFSRYCTRRIPWRASLREHPGDVARELAEVGRRIGGQSVVVPLDDESAVLLAEHASELSENFLFPPVAAGLPRRLASKAGLRELCQEFEIPTAMSAAPMTAAEVIEFSDRATFPVMVKKAGIWDDRNPTQAASAASSSSGPRLVHSQDDLLGLSYGDSRAPALIVQEYIPPECAEDWIVHVYADATSACTTLFTGRKVRSWPPVAGVTAAGVCIDNPVLAAVAEQFCKAIGYCGIADMDWCFDRRDGQYKLLDFNPRVGNNFRMFVTDSGIDVVRALHLDLTGRRVPPGVPVTGHRLVVEQADIPARIADRLHLDRPGPGTLSGNPSSAASQHCTYTSTEYAWWAADDPLPTLALLTRVVSLYKIIRHGIRSARLNAGAGRAARSGPA